MSEGAMAAMPAIGGMGRPVGRDELAEGLMLVRASTLKVVRLQLAMERRDRRTALAAVDDLVMLDGQIRTFLDAMPSDPRHDDMQRELEAQLGALAREKFTLAAGTSGNAAGPPAWIDPPKPVPAAVEEVEALEPREETAVQEDAPDWLGAPQDIRGEPEPVRRRGLYGLLVLLLVAAALVAVAMTQIPAGMGVVQLFTQGA